MNASEARFGVKSGKAHMEHGSAPKADMSEPCRHFRVVPISDICSAAKTVAIRSHRRRGRARSAARIRKTRVTEYWPRLCRSLRLDVRRADHLTPFLGFLCDQLSKVGRRERKHIATDVGKPRLQLGIGERRVDLPVE